MPKRKLFSLILILIAVVLAEIYFFDGRQAFIQEKEEVSPPSPSFHQQKNLNARSAGAPLTFGPSVSNQDRNPASIISDEAYAISQLDEHPTQTEEKLKAVATSLEESELKNLKAKALNKENNGDDRMLAVYLLSLSQHPSTTSLLEDIALASFSSANSGADLERVLRAQAIEGLQNRENRNEAVRSLSSLANQLKDSTLLDRTQRALSHHLHGTPKVEDQDKKALEALVK